MNKIIIIPDNNETIKETELRLSLQSLFDFVYLFGDMIYDNRNNTNKE